MICVRLIRHGESAANAGAATDDPALIPLTEKGVQQAQVVAGSFGRPPSLIITSPFARALATAAPTVEAYPTARVETWPVQEFTYLEPGRCANTTAAARRPWVEAYWLKADPDDRDGAHVETFRELIDRAQAVLDRLAACSDDNVAVFAHGQFISAVMWLVEHTPQTIDRQAMRNYRRFEQAHSIANGWGHEISKAGERPWQLGLQINPQGTRCENGEPLAVCGTMLLYAGKIELNLEVPDEDADEDSSGGKPSFI